MHLCTHKAFSYIIAVLLWHSNNNSFISSNILSLLNFLQLSSQFFLVVLFKCGSRKDPHVAFGPMSFKSLSWEQFSPSPLFYSYHCLKEINPIEWSTFWICLTSSSLRLWVHPFVFCISFNSKSFNKFGDIFCVLLHIASHPETKSIWVF